MLSAEDILFQIDMQLYDEFNDKFCEMNDNLGTIYSYKDLDDLEKLEKEREIKLLREAIEKQSKEIQRLEARKYMYNAETGEISQIPLDDNYISKDKIKEFIKEELPNDEICECCDIFDVNGVEIKQKLKSLLEKE